MAEGASASGQWQLERATRLHVHASADAKAAPPPSSPSPRRVGGGADDAGQGASERATATRARFSTSSRPPCASRPLKTRPRDGRWVPQRSVTLVDQLAAVVLALASTIMGLKAAGPSNV